MVTVDLFSDTVTRPTAAMRRFMCEAEVGDEQQREEHEHIDVQVNDEPEVMPAEVAVRIRPELQHALEEEGQEAAVPLAAEQALEVDLRWNDEQHPRYHGYQQANGPLLYQTAAVTVTQRERTPVMLTRPTFCENEV